MVVDGTVVNHPSDATGERAVGSGLLVISGDTRKKNP
jgi:exopolysaccharide biosynthesis protein